MHVVGPSRDLFEDEVDAIVCGAFEDVRPLRGLAGLVDWDTAGLLSRAMKNNFWRGESGDSLLFPGRPRLRFHWLVLVGLGPARALSPDAIAGVLGEYDRALVGLGAQTAFVELPGRACDHASYESARKALSKVNLSSRALWTLVDGDGAALNSEGQRDARP
jgi:hypothetical protein